MELRTHPKRLTAKIADFIAACWRDEATDSGEARAASA
jgi:hypothetical protein